MTNQRENETKINLSASDGIPKVSFAGSGDYASQLTNKYFDIAGNKFTAYYDDAHRLIFILDDTLDDRKPNVLLVINPMADRKWDDILANDYNVDLETVRPKKDNKYQKLDIDYKGLSIYNQLITDFQADRDLTTALADMSNFRTTSVRHNAADRLEVSEEAIVKTRETISKTAETLRELQSRNKKLKEKLTRQKKEIGKEPTKQSAAKILKTESQIDSTNEKQKRAKKRLNNAQRRLAVAEEDAEIARRILTQKLNYIDVPVEKFVAPASPIAPVASTPAIFSITPSEPINPEQIPEEPKAKTMGEEVKPLFDHDPEILDDKIAFKPIDFGFSGISTDPVPVIKTEPAAASDAFVAPSPLLFSPPQPVKPIVEDVLVSASPMLDTIKPIIIEDVIAPIVIEDSAPVIIDIPTPTVSDVRPVSPITGSDVAPLPPDTVRGKPTALYYIMLIILIVLSVLTLWLYQKKSVDTVPDLVATVQPSVPTPVAPTPEYIETPFIQTTVTVVQPDLVTPAVVEFDPVVPPVVIESEPENIYVEPTPVQADVPEVPVQLPTYDNGPFVVDPVYRETTVVTEPTPIVRPAVVNKPEYGVSSGEQMFVADPGYEDEYSPSYQDQYNDGIYHDDQIQYNDGYSE